DAGDAAASGDGSQPFDASASVVFPIDASTTFGFMLDRAGSGGSASPVSATLTHSFAIDRYEVTVSRFHKYTDANRPLPCGAGGQTCSLDVGGPYQTAMQWRPTWDALRGTTATFTGCLQGPQSYGSSTYTIDGGANEFPMTCVNWFDAAAFCAFEGKRLPTEIEWEYAVTSRGTEPYFPWFNSDDVPVPDCAHAIVDIGSLSPNGGGCQFPRVVGSAPSGASVQGVHDLPGSVFEWVWDRGAPSVFPVDAGSDYSGPAQYDDAGSSASRVRRGGAFNSDPTDGVTRNSGRRADFPASPTYNDMGFRCAKSLP
ncbi:MAG: hypothetical protein JWM74_4565, partial [Myxococcaceae bacterium]|nr:hypothetical protein [Myxococcaceae bacterium]